MQHILSLGLLLLLFSGCLSVSRGHNITKILAEHPEFSTFNHYLTATHLAGEINRRKTITVLVVSNADMAPLLAKHLSLYTLKNVLALHVLVDYFGAKKLHQLNGGAAASSTLFQATGSAPGTAGFVNITIHRAGRVSFAAEDAGNATHAPASAPGSQPGSPPLPTETGSITPADAWMEIPAGPKPDRRDRPGGQMTPEDFLASAGAVREEELRVSSASVQGDFGLDSVMGGAFSQQQQLPLENPVLGFGNEVHGGGGGRGRRGRKRPVLDPVDRAALQRQKRMIKNRESAARSRERKQVRDPPNSLFCFS